ncbi:Spindle pole body protein ppc89 [Pleurostoma richardsiae]|uniref:Spindle pole body protein ppc89 n=1 Tax=Pleurostoma richardsiae TaxID=41990 RepID=A0AA38VV37_9PEZI|nr:Spindle pole body protein ppc89 [Pleurostoma richardsiae]
MQQARQNPFNRSPPSSTGSHDTVSTTVGISSTFSFQPDAESTRRFDDDLKLRPRRAIGRTGRFGSIDAIKKTIDTSALGRLFPEWSVNPTISTSDENNALPLNRNIAASAQNKLNTRRDEEARFDHIDAFDTTNPGAFDISQSVQFYKGFGAAEKENIPPARDQKTPDVYSKHSKRSKADMQPTVENESDCSILSHTPGRGSQGIRTSRFSRPHPAASSGSPLPHKLVSNMPSSVRSGNEGFLSKPKTAFNQSMNASAFAMDQTGRSFFLPPFNHLNDLVSGTLKFSSMIRGVPVFVKNGKAHVQNQESPQDHAEVQAIELPDDEHRIFVSMDKIREEIAVLKEHDEMLQTEAERLQQEVDQLQAELQEAKSRKHSDSAIGSDSDHSSSERINAHLQKIKTLQARLDEAQRVIKVQELHNTSLSAERDAALQKLGAAMDASKKVEADIDTRQQEFESIKHYRHERETLKVEKKSLSADNNALRQEHESLASENQTLRSTNKAIVSQHNALRQAHNALKEELSTVREELASLQADYHSLRDEKNMVAEDHAALERNNEQYFLENKSLRTKISLLEQRNRDLQHSIANRDQLIEMMQNEPTRTQTRDVYRVAELEQELENAKKQNGVLEEKAAKYSAEARLLNAKCNKLSSVLDDRTREVREAIKEVEMRTATKMDVIEEQTNTIHTHKSAQSLPDLAARPPSPEREAKEHRRRNSDNTGQVTVSVDENMTSAFFIPDITMQSGDENTGNPTVTSNDARRVAFMDVTEETEKQEETGKQNAATTGPSLSKPARRVFDGLCKHKCSNCSVCSRLTSEMKNVAFHSTSTRTTSKTSKKTTTSSHEETREGRRKTITIPRPVPVTDRIPNPTEEYEEEPTMRPAKSPAHSLAIVLKEIQDEIEHLQSAVVAKQAEYNQHDKSAGRRGRRALVGEIQSLQRQLEIKSEQVYRLNDVLEGQKMAGQLMTEREIEATIMSITSMNDTGSWNGFD